MTDKKVVWCQPPKTGVFDRNAGVKRRMSGMLSSDKPTRDMPINKISAVEIFQNQLRLEIEKKPNMLLLCKFEQPEKAAEYLRRIVQRNKQSLRTLSIDQIGFPIETLNISELRDLKSFILDTHRDRLVAFTDLRQFYKISENVTLANITINVDQLLQFQAAKIIIDDALISSRDLNAYLKVFEIGHFPDETEELMIFTDRRCPLDFDQVVKNRSCIGKRDELDNTSFALLSTKMERIAVVEIQQHSFKMRIYSRQQFEFEEELFQRFGNDIEEEYLQRDYVFVDLVIV